jgi:hypothetical protein
MKVRRIPYVTPEPRHAATSPAFVWQRRQRSAAGKEKVAPNRWRLTDKVHACGAYGSKVFGEDLFVAAQRKHPEVGTS